MRTSDKTIEAGKVSQIFPSFIRSVCRSRFEYDPDELLDALRQSAIAQIEQSPVYAVYQFPGDHVRILSTHTVDDFTSEIRRVLSVNVLGGCPYQRELRKRACWTCPVCRAVIKKMEGNGGGGNAAGDDTDT
jgi:hypothetical protein